MKRLVLLPFVVVVAACGGSSKPVTPKQPHLPRALAQSWAQQADSVAAALAAGDGCSAQQLATSLQSQVIAAVNARRVAPRFLEPLTSGANQLVAGITCTPPAPPPEPKHDHGKHEGEKKHEHKHKDKGGD